MQNTMKVMSHLTIYQQIWWMNGSSTMKVANVKDTHMNMKYYNYWIPDAENHG